MNTKAIIATVAMTGALAHSATFEGDFMTEADYKFLQFVSENGKSYGTKEEFKFRSTIFKETLDFIEKHNNDPKETHKVGINFMADMTYDEKKKMNGYRPSSQFSNEVYFSESLDIPSSVDWRKKGDVTPVKNQGQCGSCWAFSTTEAVESVVAIQTGKLFNLSEQQLVDCSTSFGNQGCNGGLMEQGFDYVKKYGLEQEKDYPYTARDGKCHYDKSKVVAHIKGYSTVKKGSSQSLKNAIAKSPVSVSIEADQMVFQMYTGGVITSQSCGKQLDHGVLAVGYGTDESNGEDYFLVRNSWGANWGLSGYVKIGVKGDICGICDDASFPY